MAYCTDPTTHTKKRGKTHRCTWCWQPIEIGERYMKWRCYDGHVDTTLVHHECGEAWFEAAREEGGYLEITPGDGERPPKEGEHG